MEDQIEEQSDDFVTRELLHYVVEFLRFLDFPETVEVRPACTPPDRAACGRAAALIRWLTTVSCYVQQVFEEEKKRKRNLVASSLQLQPLSEEDREQLCATMVRAGHVGNKTACDLCI